MKKFILSFVLLGIHLFFFTDVEAEVAKEWTVNELVVIGNLHKLSGGRVGQGTPPSFSYKLELKVHEVLRGSLSKQNVRPAKKNLIRVREAGLPLPPVPQGVKLEQNPKQDENAEGTLLQLRHYVRQQEEPKFPKKDDVCLIALEKQGSSYRLKFWEMFNEDLASDIRLSCSLPVGWKVKGGKIFSPWADLEVEWPSDSEDDKGGGIKCSSTRRPALDWNTKATMAITKVPSVYQTNYNRDGDGEIRLKISNFTKEPLKIPALRRIGKKILWKESLVVLIQDRAFRLPGSIGINLGTEPVVLAPGEEIANTFNPLKIRDADWPSTTSVLRMNFRFCLGKHQVKEYFTYYKSHHDKIRSKLLSGQPIRPEFLGD